jgi:hypothetical protein
MDPSYPEVHLAVEHPHLCISFISTVLFFAAMIWHSLVMSVHIANEHVVSPYAGYAQILVTIGFCFGLFTTLEEYFIILKQRFKMKETSRV